MSRPQLIRLQDRPAQPWRNGGGVTRELFAWPPTGDWQVRLSVADIDRDGPFSAFPGVARWFGVLSGAGVELALPDGPVRLGPSDVACAFDGAAAPGCRLLDGPTRDLNLMLRSATGGLWRAVDGEAWHPEAAKCGLFAQQAGRVQGDDGVAHALPAMTLLWWPQAPSRLVFRCDAGDAPSPGWWLAATPQPQGSPA